MKVKPTHMDGSAILTGLLLAFCLPANLPFWMVMIGALGILISVAIPSYLRLEKSEQIDTLLSSAAHLREEISQRIGRPEVTSLENAGTESIPPSTLETFLRLYKMTANQPLAEEATIVMEPAGITRDRCARDGKIHVIPTKDVDGVLSGATILVTNQIHQGGPANDGLLAVYKVRTDPSEMKDNGTNGTQAVMK